MKFKLAILAVVLSCIPAFGQTAPVKTTSIRYLAGVTGGDNLGNVAFGLNGTVEVPVKRAEFDFTESFYPFESHVQLGSGISNTAEIQALLYIKNWGLIGSYESSIYSVPTITKSYLYGKGGFVFRNKILDKPARISIEYFQELDNGIKNGVETDHVLGGVVTFDIRFGCFKNVCIRGQEQLLYARALTQGNPLCDGSYGPDTCPRGKAVSAGANASIRFEFGNHNF